jgi:hypothetical protein
MADEIKLQGFLNTIKEIQQASQVSKADEAANASRAIKSFVESAPGGEEFGKMVAGFISYAESVKPRGKKKDPTPSKLTDGVPGIKVAQSCSASDKSSIDILVGKTSVDETVVKKLFADGSPKGIRAAISQELTNNKKQIDAALKEANQAINDPVFKEKTKELGIPEGDIQSLFSRIDAGISELSKDTESTKLVESSKKASAVQMKKLGNPFGSFASKLSIPGIVEAGDPIAPDSLKVSQIQNSTGFNFKQIADQNPFGSLGLDFGNILGAVASTTNNLPVQKDIGVPVLSKTAVSSVVSPVAAAPIEEIVKTDGSTNITTTVEKTQKLKSEPTTPVEDLNKTAYRLDPDGFIYNSFSISSLKLQVKMANREINNVNITWTGSAIDRSFNGAEEYNKKIIAIKSKINSVKNKPIHQRASWAHIFINRDGSIQGTLPIDKFGVYDHVEDNGFLLKGNKILKSGITVVVDAGHEVPFAEKNDTTYGPRSLTPEQQKTISKLLRYLTYIIPSIEAYGWDELTGVPAFGIGLDISAVLEQFRVGSGTSNYNSVNIVDEFSSTSAKPEEKDEDIEKEWADSRLLLESLLNEKQRLSKSKSELGKEAMSHPRGSDERDKAIQELNDLDGTRKRIDGEINEERDKQRRLQSRAANAGITLDQTL